MIGILHFRFAVRFIRRYFPSAESNNTLKATAKTDVGKTSPQEFHLPNQGAAESLKRASFELFEVIAIRSATDRFMVGRLPLVPLMLSF